MWPHSDLEEGLSNAIEPSRLTDNKESKKALQNEFLEYCKTPQQPSRKYTLRFGGARKYVLAIRKEPGGFNLTVWLDRRTRIDSKFLRAWWNTNKTDRQR